MSENNRSNPIQVAVVVLLLVGGGWYFLQNYEIGGLDGVTVNPKNSLEDDATYITYHDAPPILPSDVSLNPFGVRESIPTENPFSRERSAVVRGPQKSSSAPTRGYASVKIVSWALDGFGPTKLSNIIARTNVARVIRQFDVVAIQQLASIERDLVPRLVESINHGDRRYDFVMGEATGPSDRQEHLAFIFDTTRVHVDRRQTYTVDDPEHKMTFDPLVAWFRAAEPPSTQAWTFSLVNVRVDLASAPKELALLPEMLASIRSDGRGEDDIVLAGLFQADDAYLLPTIAGQNFKAAIHSRPTDIFGRYQTSNLLVDAALTSEYLGRGGVFDFLRHYELNLAEAEAVTSHLPVYAEFTATEGGNL